MTTNVSDNESKISYNSIINGMGLHAQYVFMLAGITNGVYYRNDLLSKLDVVSEDMVSFTDNKKFIETQKIYARSVLGNDYSIKIENFNPDKTDLEQKILEEQNYIAKMKNLGL